MIREIGVSLLAMGQAERLTDIKRRRAPQRSNGSMKNRIRRCIAELGWHSAAWYALSRLVESVGWRLQRYLFVAQRVATEPARQRCNGCITVSPIVTMDEVPPGYPRCADILSRRFRQGAHSLAAWRGEQLAGFIWYQFGAYQEDDVRVRYCLPSPHSAWDFDVFVQPEMRLGPAFCRLWDATNRRLHAVGVQWTCSRISAFNPESLRAHRRMGATPLGSAVFLCCGEWQWMVASQFPWFHLSRHENSFPKLVFDTKALERLT